MNIPEKIYERIGARVASTDFESVDKYVTYVLEKVLDEVEEKPKEEGYSKEDEEKVKERLRSLGYLE